MIIHFSVLLIVTCIQFIVKSFICSERNSILIKAKIQFNSGQLSHFFESQHERKMIVGDCQDTVLEKREFSTASVFLIVSAAHLLIH